MLDDVSVQVPQTRGRWRGEAVEDGVDLPVAYLRQHLPAFDRAPLGRNRFKDIIKRREDGLPVAIVSKRYRLIQHFDVADAIVDAAARAGIESAGLRAHLTLTEYSTRMALRVILPERFVVYDRSGYGMALTFECCNSVGGTVPLFALVGWFRFVCRNGLAVGTTMARVRRKHLPAASSTDLARVRSLHIWMCDSMCRWRRTSISIPLWSTKRLPWAAGAPRRKP